MRRTDNYKDYSGQNIHKSGSEQLDSGGDNISQGRSRKENATQKTVLRIAAAGIVCLAVAAGTFIYLKNRPEADGVPSGVKQEKTSGQTVMVDGMDLTGLSREEAKKAIETEYPWSLKVSFGEQVYEVPNLVEDRIEKLLDQIYEEAAVKSYSFDTTGMDNEAAAEAEIVASMWDKPAVNGGLTGYDKDSGTFQFGGGEIGIKVDQQQLAEEISRATAEKEFNKNIEAGVTELEPEATGGEAAYKTLGSYTTSTTANKGRNININLSAQALNGTIIKPGEEFSFNGAVGERTVKKGYQSAAAYSNGEVVQEIGGGVCQLSTTLYNAVLISGLEITNRKSHTFQPSYVTPGQDATVSWGAPDFKFRNNSDMSIGIQANYADRKVTVSVYGVPILEEGVEYALKSRKLGTLGAPAPTYVEDPALLFGQEVVKSGGSSGSKWETRLVITKNGQVISEEVDHTAVYKGHAPVIARNSAAVPETVPVIPETPPVETEPTAPIEIGPGVQPQPTAPTADQGPGVVETQTAAGPGQ